MYVFEDPAPRRGLSSSFLPLRVPSPLLVSPGPQPSRFPRSSLDTAAGALPVNALVLKTAILGLASGKFLLFLKSAIRFLGKKLKYCMWEFGKEGFSR